MPSISMQIREWAIGKGLEIKGNRGRVPRDIVQQYVTETGNTVPDSMLQFTSPREYMEKTSAEPFIIPGDEPEWIRRGRERAEAMAQRKLAYLQKAYGI